MALKQMKLNRTIQVGFMVILILIVINGAATFWAMRKMEDNASWVAHTYNVKAQLEHLIGELTNAETGQRGFLYTSQEEFLEPYQNALRRIQADHKTILATTRNPVQLQHLQIVSELTRQKLDEMAEVISLYKADKKKEALDLVVTTKGKKIMDNIRAEVDEMISLENSLLEQRTRDLEAIQNIAFLLIAVGTFFAFATGLFIFLFISRNVIRNFILPVNEAIGVMSSTSIEILSTVEQHERTASQQAAAASEASATLAELSASSRQTAEQAANSAALAEKSGAATAQGGDTTQQAVAAMISLRDKIGAMAEQIMHLGEQSGQIGSIATVLKDLAGQINMLALNAAVEAARAGEHGKGFAVVAGEIRKLADQSKKSAEQTAVLVADIQKATHSSIMITEGGTRTVADVTQLVQKVAELFHNLAGMAASVNENAQQVMLNVQQQSAAFTQIVEATSSIAAGAKETAAGISQTRVGVQKLNEAAENLKAIA